MRSESIEHRPLKAESIIIAADTVELDGDIFVPERAKGLVLFAHGSGSSRFSRRNRHVASLLQEQDLATLLFDLLSSHEEEQDESTCEFRIDIDLLTRRLIAATDWVRTEDRFRYLKIGYFGASTGAAAAIQAAALRKDVVHAVVSRGGRPDLAQAALRHITAPVLLIVGGEDDEVLDLNISALNEIQAAKQLEVVPGATHLFEEPGTLDEAARLAALWFNYYLT